MKVRLVDPGRPELCRPITSQRDLLDCKITNRRFREIWSSRLEEFGISIAEDPEKDADWSVRGDCWLSDESLGVLAGNKSVDALRIGEERVAWRSVPGSTSTIDPDPEQNFLVRYPWDLLRINELLIGGLESNRIEGEISPGAICQGFLQLGEGSVVLPGVFLEGNVVVGRNCKIGPNCYIRGASSIGNGCRIGQAVEVKNSLIMDGTSIGHLSYCGDSVVGEGVNFGAGTITANFRHDGRPHQSMVGGKLLDTGRRKFGAVIGDGVHTGIHTSIYPGRKLWPHTSTRPGAVIQYDLTESAE